MLIDVADAHQGAIFRAHFGAEAVEIGERRMEQSHDGAERHAVHVAAGRSFGRVDVAVRVDPHQADALISAAIKFRDAGNGSCSDGVIAAKSQWDLPGLEGLDHQFGLRGASFRDLGQILGVGVTLGFGLEHGDRNVAAVLDVIAEGFEFAFQPGNAHCRRTHVHAAAGLAKVKRHTDDADVLGFQCSVAVW